MFGIGPMEFLVIAIFAVVFIGPKKLPEIMKQVARFLVQARRYSNDLKGQFNEVMRAAEADIAREELNKLKQELRDVTPLITQQPSSHSPAAVPSATSEHHGSNSLPATPDLSHAGSFDKPLDHSSGEALAPGHVASTPDLQAHSAPVATGPTPQPSTTETSSTGNVPAGNSSTHRDDSSRH